MVNQFYVYCMDRDFGPFFLKFSSYFPCTAKLCINGHECAKQRSITACCAAPIPNACSRSAMG
jgi:hypothetical protein